MGKTFILFVAVFILNHVGYSQSMIPNYKDYKIQVNGKWYGADAAISKEEIKGALSLVLQNKANPKHNAVISSYQWQITPRKTTNWFTGSSSTPVTDEQITNSETGDVFFLNKIEVEGADKNFPTRFRLTFK